MKKKEVLWSALFAGALIALLWLLSSLFNFRDLQWANRIKTFRGLEKNTVDAVLVGTSGMDRYWIGPKAYEEYGITMYPLSSDDQAAWMMKYVLEEAKKKQDIKLAVIDMRPFRGSFGEDMERQEAATRRVLDELPFFSINRLKAAKTAADVMQTSDPDGDHNALSYYLPFVKFHSQWEEQGFLLDEDDEKFQPFLGFFIRDTVSVKGMDEFPVTEKTDRREELDPSRGKALYDLMEYLSGQDYEVLFLNTPHYMNPQECARLNTVCDILDEYGFAYKCYDVEDNTFNVNAEFYNGGHVNYFGAERFTELFAQYLKDNYDLPDRREDSRCSAVWYGPYDAIKEQVTQFFTYKQMERPVLAVETTADDGIKISWNMQEKADGYEIYRNTREGGRYERLKRIKNPAVTEFTDRKVDSGTDYYYMIRAYRKVNGTRVYSRYSEVLSTK